ncbi:MAG: DsbA family protein [Salinarimonadaceae bacterium]|nr:MAG: DsbA family protein [Salinarimonadaceae bacterium]
MNFVIKGALAAGFLAIGAMTVLGGAAAQQQRFTAEETQAIESIVRDYLLSNPEIVHEMFAELERREQVAREDSRRRTLETSAALLYEADDIILGNPDGDVTLVEFFDYNCGYCKRALEDLHAMIADDPDLRVVLKDYPVLGPGSLEAARIVLAARNQLSPSQAAEFHIRLMETRGLVNAERATSFARDLGLDVARLEVDANSDDVREILVTNYQLADDLGLTGTPAWVIGDQVVSGAVGKDRLAAAVQNVRRCGSVVC